MKPNATSIDFPLYTHYGNKAPSSLKLLSPRSITNKVRTSCVHEYNNETPDFFRLDSMVKSSQRYNNPFLNEVINADRSESLKSLENSRSQIYYIDKLKSSRNLSQNTVLLRKIQNESCKAIKKSIRDHSMPVSLSELCSTEEKYKEKLSALHHLYTPKICFKLKKRLDMSKNVDVTERFKCSLYDKEQLDKLQTAFDPKKSSYLRNLNEYDIKENMGVTYNSRFHFDRVKEEIYNPIIDKKMMVMSPIITNEKWNKVNETYILMLGNFRRKGGLFSEFFNKNRASVDLMNVERSLRLKAKMEKKKNIKA